MSERGAIDFLDQLPLLCCPGCRMDLELSDDRLVCTGCGHSFEIADGIPLLFWPNDWDESHPGDVTDAIRAFYEETPFPSYDEFDNVASLIEKSRRAGLAKLLDDHVPPGATVVECGCGTGQLSNFLSVANRTVIGADLCHNSLKLGHGFKRANQLERVHFLQMNLFRPPLKHEAFDLVISNGVLHHTADPFLAFREISKLVRPGGYILVGLYHRYGRLVTDLRRAIFRFSRDRFTFLDPNLRKGGMRSHKWRAWFMDQYKNPHESKHTIGEVMGWLEKTGFQFVRSIPSTKPFQSFSPTENLFGPQAPGSALERSLVELGMVRGGSREGGFFVVVGRRP